MTQSLFARKHILDSSKAEKRIYNTNKPFEKSETIIKIQSQPLISIIIPVYNVLPYLRESLNSAIHQTYKNVEIIIVDDGSTDGSTAICDEYRKDARVKVIHLPENSGLSSARNTGINLMTGDYVAFLDSDDAYSPMMIEQLLNAITQYNADLAVCGFAICETESLLSKAKRKGRVQPKRNVVLSGYDTYIALLDGMITFPVWNKLYSAKLWNNLRFPERGMFEDIRTTPYVLSQCYRTAVVSQSLVYYRYRNNSITQSVTIQSFQDRIEAYKLFQNALIQVYPPLPSKSIKTFQETLLRKLILIYIKQVKRKSTQNIIHIMEKEINVAAADAKPFMAVKTKLAWFQFRMYYFSNSIMEK